MGISEGALALEGREWACQSSLLSRGWGQLASSGFSALMDSA